MSRRESAWINKLSKMEIEEAINFVQNVVCKKVDVWTLESVWKSTIEKIVALDPNRAVEFLNHRKSEEFLGCNYNVRDIIEEQWKGLFKYREKLYDVNGEYIILKQAAQRLSVTEVYEEFGLNSAKEVFKYKLLEDLTDKELKTLIEEMKNLGIALRKIERIGFGFLNEEVDCNNYKAECVIPRFEKCIKDLIDEEECEEFFV